MYSTFKLLNWSLQIHLKYRRYASTMQNPLSTEIAILNVFRLYVYIDKVSDL